MLVRFVACFSGFLLTLYLPSSGVQGGTECKTCERPQRPALPHARSPDPLPTLRPFTSPSAASFLHPSPRNGTATKPTRRADDLPRNKHFLSGAGRQVIYCLREIRNTSFFSRVAVRLSFYVRTTAEWRECPFREQNTLVFENTIMPWKTKYGV